MVKDRVGLERSATEFSVFVKLIFQQRGYVP